MKNGAKSIVIWKRCPSDSHQENSGHVLPIPSTALTGHRFTSKTTTKVVISLNQLSTKMSHDRETEVSLSVVGTSDKKWILCRERHWHWSHDSRRLCRTNRVVKMAFGVESSPSNLCVVWLQMQRISTTCRIRPPATGVISVWRRFRRRRPLVLGCSLNWSYQLSMTVQQIF